MTKRFKLIYKNRIYRILDLQKDEGHILTGEENVELLNNLIEERDYWKKNAMTLLMQVRSLTPRMTDEEVRRFNQELGG